MQEVAPLDASLRRAFEAVLNRANFESLAAARGLLGLLDSGACHPLLAAHKVEIEALLTRLLDGLSASVDDYERAELAGRLLRHLQSVR